MLTTRSADGQIHSRAMNPVARRFAEYMRKFFTNYQLFF